MKSSALLLATALLAGPSVAQQAQAPFVVEETGKSYWRLDDAVKAVGDNDVTITIAPGRYPECAVQEAGRIAYRAAQPGTAIFDGGACEGKATLVLRGRAAVVEGLVFQNVRVPDLNGAGIRLEKGSLQVSDTIFRDSQQGILSAEDPSATIEVDRSTFSGLGRCDGGASCAHSLYIGKYGSLKVTRSRFERGNGGHYVKSRAGRIKVTDCSFDDTRGRTTNYMIDLPAGAVGTIARNVFVQGTNKENHSAFIAVAAEARENRSAGLSVTGNKATLAPGVSWSTSFVADWSHEPLQIAGNQIGAGIKPFETR